MYLGFGMCDKKITENDLYEQKSIHVVPTWRLGIAVYNMYNIIYEHNILLYVYKTVDFGLFIFMRKHKFYLYVCTRENVSSPVCRWILVYWWWGGPIERETTHCLGSWDESIIIEQNGYFLSYVPIRRYTYFNGCNHALAVYIYGIILSNRLFLRLQSFLLSQSIISPTGNCKMYHGWWNF